MEGVLPFSRNQSRVRGQKNTLEAVYIGEHPRSQDKVEEEGEKTEKVTQFPKPGMGAAKTTVRLSYTRSGLQ